jgi:aminomethyltransferase
LTELQRTPLWETHRALGARMVPFAGFEMPVQYASILDEHAAVRERAGLFDVSHMGQIWLEGAGAEAAVERLVTCPVASLAPGQVRYGLLCNERGGTVDDVTVYRAAGDRFLVVVNASNVEKDYRWIVRHTPAGVEVRNRSAETGLLALQGPRAATILARVVDADLAKLRRFRFVAAKAGEDALLVSRTGYTGSDGFELYCAAGACVRLWERLLAAGREDGLVPAGLGARDTLRLEAALPLYGHELDDDTTPLEAGLERFVKLARGGFLGAEALAAQRARGLAKRLAGFELIGRGIARGGHAIAREGREIGLVTSGAPSPTLGKSIGLGYVPPAFAEQGELFDVIVRGRPIAARVVATPFVRASSPGA